MRSTWGGAAMQEVRGWRAAHLECEAGCLSTVGDVPWGRQQATIEKWLGRDVVSELKKNWHVRSQSLEDMNRWMGNFVGCISCWHRCHLASRDQLYCWGCPNSIIGLCSDSTTTCTNKKTLPLVRPIFDLSRTIYLLHRWHILIPFLCCHMIKSYINARL